MRRDEAGGECDMVGLRVYMKRRRSINYPGSHVGNKEISGHEGDAEDE